MLRYIKDNNDFVLLIMNELPNELLLMILDKLPPQELHKLTSVCKRWLEINRDRVQLISKRNTIRVTSQLRALFVTVPFPNLIQQLSFATNLRSLTITANAGLKPNDFSILTNFSNLRHIDVFSDLGIITALPPHLNSVVANDILTKDCMKTLKATHNLSNLHYFGRGRAITATHFKSIIHLHKDNLEELTLKCRELPSRAYQCFYVCSKLIALRLYECWRLCKDHSLFVTRSTNLKVLHITGIRLMSSKSLAGLIKSLPLGLRELCLSASLLNDTHMGILIERVPFLEVFEAWRCNYSPSGILNLTEGLRKLLALDIDIPLNAFQLHILDNHPRLKQVRCLVQDNINENLKIKVLRADKKDGLFRNIGEGYRSDIFYYCKRNCVQLYSENV